MFCIASSERSKVIGRHNLNGRGDCDIGRFTNSECGIDDLTVTMTRETGRY